jgi:GNAT superfamily N-acetyltransferase
VDTATHPDWRGRGIFSQLTTRLVEQMRREGASFIYNTPNAQSMPGYLKMGWTHVGRVPLWIRAHRIARAVRRSVIPRRDDTPVFGGSDTVLHALRDERLPAFLSDVAPVDDRYHTARTLPYLAWRYRDVPGLTYQARFETAGDAGALLIARGRSRGRLREVTISELLVTPSSRGVQLGRDVLSSLLSSADADYVAACAFAGSADRSVLARSGFLPIPRIGPHFTTRRLTHNGPDPSTWASWRCSIGDLELF